MSSRFVKITDPEKAARLGMAGLLWWDGLRPDANEAADWRAELKSPTDRTANVRAGRYFILLEE